MSSSKSAPSSASDAGALPPALASRLNGQLDGQTVVAWASFDLDEANAYAERFAVVTEDQLVVIRGNGLPETFPLSSIEEAKIVEGQGVDRLEIIAEGVKAAEMRYSRRHRRGMTRLHRKIERRLPKKAGKDLPPEWLDQVEREAEQKDRCATCGEMIPSYAEGVCPRCLQKKRILWRLLDVTKPYRWRIYFSLALTIGVSVMATMPPLFTKYLIDDAVQPEQLLATGVEAVSTLPASERMRSFWFWSGMIALTILVSEVIAGFRLYILSRVGTQVTADLRHQVYAHLHELSLRYFAKRRTGSLITRVTNDTDRLWDFIVFGSVNLIRDVAMIIFVASIMFWLDWRLALVSLIPLPILAILSYRRGMRMQQMFGRLWTYWARMTAVVGDALPGVRVVKAFSNEHREVARFDRRSDEYTAKEQEIHAVWTSLATTVSALMRLGGLLILMYGGYRVIQGESTVGTLLAFIAYLSQFYQPIMELANSNRMVTRAATSAQRIYEVLDTPPDIFSKQGAIQKPSLEGRIEFKQVSFSYEGAQPALREISMLAEPGEMIGLCGPSGAGKSTFVNLICRFYDATDGQILIDGIDIRDYDVKWLRRQVGMVLQEPYLFHGTISENIRYGNPDATEDQIITAAKAANAHDFVVGFPDGYDTMVGERGQSLSGGERQRISIARAILHNPRILILDEATSSVDTETEKQIQQALDRLVEGRTTFAIAHRLSTLTAADRLIVLEKGKIVEQGLHADLVNKEDGVYAKLHKTQAEMSSMVAIR